MNLRFWRQEREMTQGELSQATGIPKWAVKLTESGNRDLTSDEERKIRTILNIPENKGLEVV